MAAKYGVFVDGDNSKLTTLYWLPKFHKIPYKLLFNKSKSKRFLASSVSTYDFSTLYSTLPR